MNINSRLVHSYSALVCAAVFKRNGRAVCILCVLLSFVKICAHVCKYMCMYLFAQKTIGTCLENQDPGIHSSLWRSKLDDQEGGLLLCCTHLLISFEFYGRNTYLSNTLNNFNA